MPDKLSANFFQLTSTDIAIRGWQEETKQQNATSNSEHVGVHHLESKAPVMNVQKRAGG